MTENRKSLANLVREVGDLIEGAGDLGEADFQRRAIASLRQMIHLAQIGLVQLDTLLEAAEGDQPDSTKPAPGAASPGFDDDTYEITID